MNVSIYQVFNTSLRFPGSEILSEQKQFRRVFPAAFWLHSLHRGVESGRNKD